MSQNKFIWKPNSSVKALIGKESDGHWYCKDCGSPAEIEHNKEECVKCRNGWGCSRDCTLSRVACSNCNIIWDI